MLVIGQPHPLPAHIPQTLRHRLVPHAEQENLRLDPGIGTIANSPSQVLQSQPLCEIFWTYPVRSPDE